MTSTGNFSQRVDALRKLIAETDAIIIGAGSGLSTAAGLDYAGEDFRREFAPWIERYGFTDLYTSAFYPFETEEERWAYWARHIWFSRFRTGGTELYRRLLPLVEGKEWFVITTNTDGQFEQSGFARDRIFATQGDYAYLQSRSGEDKELVYCKDWVFRAMAATEDCRIPASLVPRHPRTGELLAPNLRCDDTFVEDDRWHRQAERYHDFVRRHCQGRLLLLEFGIGFNTPAIIRFPFEHMALNFPQTALVRFNRDYPDASLEGIEGHFMAFTEDISTILNEL
ncbi:MAG: Sir2 silent information regulator family NAD-dependent deacetylase [Bacteroidales bacterium]|nr:Sir2 silent information regulator family NAD-dependent deacetylase [Bacteroidales bacterium]